MYILPVSGMKLLQKNHFLIRFHFRFILLNNIYCKLKLLFRHIKFVIRELRITNKSRFNV